MIFVTLGSQKFPFDRLLAKIDDLVEDGTIGEEVFAQIGASTYCPRHYEYTDYMDRDAFDEKRAAADLLITHGGTGAIIGAVKRGIRVIAVPRLARYGEHVDDHQLQLLRQFSEMKLIEACLDVDDLAAAYARARVAPPPTYVSGTERYIEAIDNFIRETF